MDYMTSTSGAESINISDVLRPMVRSVRRALFDMRGWRSRAYAGPSPKAVKDRVLLRNALAGGTWVETGTFLGETTRLLAIGGGHVYSLEPATGLYERAAKKFSTIENVTIIHGPSEDEFPLLLPLLKGPVNFWLDGHFSAGATFQGASDTPIMAELEAIEQNLSHLQPICVMVDDIRCFDPSQSEYASYPPLDSLVDWARKHGLIWHIEHDIMIMRTHTRVY